MAVQFKLFDYIQEILDFGKDEADPQTLSAIAAYFMENN
jgi:hypothetical protein